jgi:hypothetical protein
MRRLVAIALSTVAPIFAAKANGEGPMRLSTAQINEFLYRPADAAAYTTLDQLCIRRGDLRTALKVLKEARMAFGNTK